MLHPRSKKTASPGSKSRKPRRSKRARKRDAARKRSGQLHFESLEARRLLCTTVGIVGGDLVISDSTGICDQTVTLTSDALAEEFRIDDGQGTTTQVPFTDVTGAVRVDLLGGNDSLTVDVLGVLPVEVHFDGGTGINTFSASDESGVYRVTQVNAGVFDPSFDTLLSDIYFENTQNLVAGAAGSSISRTFAFASQGSLSGNIDGLGANDRLELPDDSLTDLSSTEVSVGGATVLGGFTGMETVTGSNTGTLLGPSSQATDWVIEWDSSLGGFAVATVSGFETTFVRYADFVGGDHDDTFLLRAGVGGLSGISIDGGGGVNVLQGSEYGVVFETLGVDSGNVTTIPSTDALPFAGISRLEGSAANDQFIWNGGWQGEIDGGGGDNSLSAFGDLDISVLNNSFSSIEINAPAALVGSGEVGANVDVHGTLRPGASPGTMTAGGWHLFGTSTAEFEFAGSGSGEYDQLGAVGDVLIDAGAELDLQLLGGFVPEPNQTYKLIDVAAGGSITGNFEGLPEGAVINGFLDTPYDAEISYQGGEGNDLVLTVSGTPTEVATTTVSLDSQGNLLIQDTAGGDSDDSLELRYDFATDRIVIADQNLVLESTIPGALQPNRNTIEVEVGLISGDRIRIETLGGNDSVRIPAGLTKPVEFVGGEGSDTLIGGDSGQAFDVTGSNSGIVTDRQLTFTKVENLTGGVGDDQFIVSESGRLSGEVDGGAGYFDEDENYVEGLDSLAVFASGAQEFNLETGQVVDLDDLQIRVGSWVDIEAIGAGEFAGPDQDVIAGAHVPTDWLIDDAGDGQVNGLLFQDFAVLEGGTDADHYTLRASGGQVTIAGGQGNDTITGSDLGSVFQIDGMGAGQIDGGDVAFSGIENLIGGIRDDGFFFSEDGRISGTVDGGSGYFDEDEDFVEGFDSLSVIASGAQEFDLESGQVTDLGDQQVRIGNVLDFEALEAGNFFDPTEDVLVGANVANQWLIDGAGDGRVNELQFINFAKLVGGSDTDQFEFTNTGRSVHVEGDGGLDTILGAPGGEFYEISGLNSGNIGSIGTFSGIENLTGRSGNDDFVLFDGGRITGMINGGSGDDGEEYSEGTDGLFILSAGAQVVDLEASVVTDLDTALVRIGSFAEFEIFGAGNFQGPALDILVGQDVPSDWQVTGNGDGSVNGVQFINFSELHGGSDNDLFTVATADAGLAIDGGAGIDSLTGPDLEETFQLNGSESGSLQVADVMFGDIEQLVGGSADDQFRVATSANSMQLDGGAGSNSVVAVDGGVVDVELLADSFDLVEAETGGRIVGHNELQADLDVAGTLSPGASPGTIGVHHATLRSNSVFEWEIGGTGAGEFDQLAVGGDLTIDSDSQLVISALAGLQLEVGDFVTLIDVQGANPIAGAFAGFAPNSVVLNFLGSGLNAEFNYSGGDGNDLVVTMVNPNSPPVFTSPDSAEVPENQTEVMTVVASDSDLPAQTITLAITGAGADDYLFELDEQGQLRFLTAPDFEAPQDADQNNVYEVQVSADDGAGGFTTQTIQISVLNQASITGSVFLDANENGLFDANELGLDGVDVELLDAIGNAILDDAGNPLVATTTDGGYLLFDDLSPGTYQLRELQPSGVDDGQETLGTLGGTIVANDTMQLTLQRTDGQDYQFAELGQQLTSGDTAGIGFWQNKHGQSLIRSGGAPLATWLTDNFGNVFGNTFTDGVGSDDASEVASYYRNQLFKQKSGFSKGPKVDAQFMATALATFFTSSNLAGDVAASYGFNVTEMGIGTKLVNVGSSGAAFGVDDGTELTILQLLLATNEMTDVSNNREGGAGVYDLDGDGVISAHEAALRDQANAIYSQINAG